MHLKQLLKNPIKMIQKSVLFTFPCFLNQNYRVQVFKSIFLSLHFISQIHIKKYKYTKYRYAQLVIYSYLFRIYNIKSYRSIYYFYDTFLIYSYHIPRKQNIRRFREKYILSHFPVFQLYLQLFTYFLYLSSFLIHYVLYNFL